MTRTAIALSALFLLTAGPAGAQVTPSDLTVELSGAENVGIDNCATDIEDEFTLNGTLELSLNNDYELRLTWATSTSPCSREDLAGCPSTNTVNDVECGCLAEVSDTTTISVQDNVSDFFADACEQAAGSTSRIYFFLEYNDDAGDDQETSEGSSEQSILIDFDRPSAPAAAPAVEAVENGLEVSFSELDDSDIDYYEVCAQAMVAGDAEGGADDAAEGNVALRDGFEASSCKKFTSTSGRFTGLENGVNYVVVYAGFDEAGNRGPNSPVATGTPAEVQDFAELYVAENGTERGGCSSTGGSAPLIALMVLLGLTRRRETHA